MEWHASSPWERGVGFRAAPAFPLSQPGTSVHPMLSYSYLAFDGGHDDRFEAGGQLRRRTTWFGTDSAGLWLGGEAALALLRTSIDGLESESTTGFSATALAGFPLGQNRWGASLYAGAGLSHYGSTGRNLRIGLDLQPWFLRR